MSTILKTLRKLEEDKNTLDQKLDLKGMLLKEDTAYPKSIKSDRRKFFLLTAVILILSACQKEQEKTVETTGKPEVKQEAPLVKEKTSDVAVPVDNKNVNEANSSQVAKPHSTEVELPVKNTDETVIENVDLTVSGKYLEKIDEQDEDYLATPPPLGEKLSNSTDKGKVKLSGKVIVDDEEKAPVKKIDGGEVKATFPIN